MKKLFIALFMLASVSLFSQISQGDIQIIQQYFGVEKAALIKEYMNFTSQQDTDFWPIYENYERERQEIGKQRIAMVDDYLSNVQDISAEKATELVNRSEKLEVSFKKLQKKYFNQMSKKIGPVKASQFYQFENYLNNIINLSIQENIPFIGELEQKHANEPRK